MRPGCEALMPTLVAWPHLSLQCIFGIRRHDPDAWQSRAAEPEPAARPALAAGRTERYAGSEANGRHPACDEPEPRTASSSLGRSAVRQPRTETRADASRDDPAKATGRGDGCAAQHRP